MNLINKYVKVTNLLTESEYYKVGDVFKVVNHGSKANLLKEDSVVLENGMVLIGTEYELVKE